MHNLIPGGLLSIQNGRLDNTLANLKISDNYNTLHLLLILIQNAVGLEKQLLLDNLEVVQRCQFSLNYPGSLLYLDQMKGPVEKRRKWWLQVENLNWCCLAEHWRTGWFSCEEHCWAFVSWPESFNLKN